MRRLVVVAERGPGGGPGLPQPGRDVDLNALLLVRDAKAVPERGDGPDVRELAPEQARVDVHGEDRRVAGWRRSPEPEVVVPAIGRGEAEAGSVAVDGPGLAVVRRQDRGVHALPPAQRRH